MGLGVVRRTHHPPGDGVRRRTCSSDHSPGCRALIAGVLAPAMTQAHLVDRVSRRLGGLTRTWRFDRKATVCHSDFVGSRPASPASPNATAPRWRFAHRGPETAQEWRRRPIPLLPSAGGAPCPTISPSNEPSRGWMSSVVCGATPGCLPPRTGRATVVTVAASEQLTEPQRTRMQARGGCFADPAPQGVFSSTLDFRLTPVAGAKDSRLFSTAGLRNGFRRGHGAHNVARNAPPPRQALHHECEGGVLLYM